MTNERDDDDASETVDGKVVSDDGKKHSCERPPLSWWREYVGKPIAIQFHDGVAYIGVTYPNQFLLKDGSPVAVPIMRGVLLKVREEPNGSSWLVVQTSDPDPAKPNVRIDIAFRSDLVAFASMLDRSLIAT